MEYGLWDMNNGIPVVPQRPVNYIVTCIVKSNKHTSETNKRT